uniref:(northern house mosquito) hypothetical protein n=1 Tax=Culex pipiens TaxID=7175 RepID=A0A8D8JLE7_CULPI
MRQLAQASRRRSAHVLTERSRRTVRTGLGLQTVRLGQPRPPRKLLGQLGRGPRAAQLHVQRVRRLLPVDLRRLEVSLQRAVRRPVRGLLLLLVPAQVLHGRGRNDRRFDRGRSARVLGWWSWWHLLLEILRAAAAASDELRGPVRNRRPHRHGRCRRFRVLGHPLASSTRSTVIIQERTVLRVVVVLLMNHVPTVDDTVIVEVLAAAPVRVDEDVFVAVGPWICGHRERRNRRRRGRIVVVTTVSGSYAATLGGQRWRDRVPFGRLRLVLLLGSLLGGFLHLDDGHKVARGRQERFTLA